MTRATEKYQAEQIQSEKDHHLPTAGAMSGHILANLAIQQTKLKQAAFFVTGLERMEFSSWFKASAKKESRLFDRVAQVLLDEGEVIPTTTAEFTEYSMLTESGVLKYESSETLLTEAGRDFNTQLLFITRGIVLAKKENKVGLELALEELETWIRHQIFSLQATLGKELVEQEEEEDEF